MPNTLSFRDALGSQCNQGSARRAGPACGMTPMAAAIAGLFALHSLPAWSATIVVDDVACKLAQAIDNANSDSDGGRNGCAAGNGDDTLVLQFPGELRQRASLPAVSTKITIQGSNKTSIRAEGEGFRLMEVSTGGELELIDTRLSGASNPGQRGGAILVGLDATLTVRDSVIEQNRAVERGGAGAAIANESGRVTLIDTVIRGNDATYGGGIHSVGVLTLVDSKVLGNRSPTSGGGGIACAGTCTLTDSMVSNNTSARGGGGIFNAFDTSLTLIRTTISENSAKTKPNDSVGGGGIENRGTATLRNSTVSGNRAGIVDDRDRIYADGGGIHNIGVLTLDRSKVSGNSAAASGGGISNFGGGVLYLDRSSVSGNSARFNGGGIFSQLPDRNGGSYLRHSTVSGNTASVQVGGGIYNKVGKTYIERSTITENTAAVGSGIFSRSDSASEEFIATTLTASIVSGNENDTDVVFIDPDQPSQGNTFVSDGSNLIGSGDALDAFRQDLGDITGEVDPGLDPLAENGGPTPTHALKPNSLAVDASACDGTLDQRGVKRPKNGKGGSSATECDIGAFELGRNSVDLSITNRAAPSSVPVEGLITYTLTVKNLGRDTANAVRSTDVLPGSLSFESLMSSTGACENFRGTVSCELGDLPAGGSRVVRLRARALNAGSIRNRAAVTSDALIDADANPADNAATATVSVTQATGKPIPFQFVDIAGVRPGTVQTSQAIEVRGINAPVFITVSKGQYSINEGGFTNGPGMVSDGDIVRARHTSAGNFGAAANTTITIGTNTDAVSDVFTSTTEAADITPEISGSFFPLGGVFPGSSAVSNEITVSDINVPVMISLSGAGAYSINGGTPTREPRRVSNGNRIKVSHTASAEFGTPTHTTVTVGGADANSAPRSRVAKTFTSTTRARDVAVDVKPQITGTFGESTDALRDQFQTSDEITVGGLSLGVKVIISMTGAGAYSIDDGVPTSGQGTVGNGQKVRVSHQSSREFNTPVQTTVTIGGTSPTGNPDDKVQVRFQSTTLADEDPDTFDFLDRGGVKPEAFVKSNTITVRGLGNGEQVEMKLACINEKDLASEVNGTLVAGPTRSRIKNGDKIVLINRIDRAPRGVGRSKCEITIGQGKDRDGWTISAQ